eukprot:1191031-Prorocentrum_minimum.AAC.1
MSSSTSSTWRRRRANGVRGAGIYRISEPIARGYPVSGGVYTTVACSSEVLVNTLRNSIRAVFAVHPRLLLYVTTVGVTDPSVTPQTTSKGMSGSNEVVPPRHQVALWLVFLKMLRSFTTNHQLPRLFFARAEKIATKTKAKTVR